MRIEEVITETIIAIYRDPSLSSRLYLKGGSAMRLFDKLTSRLSIDVDFSIEDTVDKDKDFFTAIKNNIGASFRNLKFDIIDFKWGRKPKTPGREKPDWWGGWECEFKLVPFSHRGKSIETKRRNALVPEGANSSKVIVDVSEHEYCGKSRRKTILGVKILGYSRELLVLEKIRAICQQHPDYKYRLNKNRARDFYDIYEMTADVDDEFAHRCSRHIEKVFKAKDVPLHILGALWKDDFIDEHRRGFDQVKDTVRGDLQNFDVYVEHLRFLTMEIYPQAVSA